MPNQRAPGVTPRTVAFPDELWERVQERAEQEGTSPSVVVRTAVRDLLDEEPICRPPGVEWRTVGRCEPAEGPAPRRPLGLDLSRHKKAPPGRVNDRGADPPSER